MTKYRISAPDGRFSGEFAGLVFRAGEAAAETPADFAAVTYCRRRGYKVIAADNVAGHADDGLGVVVDKPVRPADYAAKSDWVTYALDVDKKLTREDAEAATKNELIEKYGKDNR